MAATKDNNLRIRAVQTYKGAWAIPLRSPLYGQVEIGNGVTADILDYDQVAPYQGGQAFTYPGAAGASFFLGQVGFGSILSIFVFSDRVLALQITTDIKNLGTYREVSNTPVPAGALFMHLVRAHGQTIRANLINTSGALATVEYCCEITDYA